MVYNSALSNHFVSLKNDLYRVRNTFRAFVRSNDTQPAVGYRSLADAISTTVPCLIPGLIRFEIIEIYRKIQRAFIFFEKKKTVGNYFYFHCQINILLVGISFMGAAKIFFKVFLGRG